MDKLISQSFSKNSGGYMNKSKIKKQILTSGMVGASILLSACVAHYDNSKTSETSSPSKLSLKMLSEDVVPKEQEQLNAIYFSDTPFKGLLDPMFYMDNLDQTLLEPAYRPIFSNTASGKITNNGLVHMLKNEQNQSVTLTVDSSAHWSDGKKLKAEDIIFPYYIIGSKDYQGLRFSKGMEQIIGMKEYHAGKTKKLAVSKQLMIPKYPLNFLGCR